MLLSISSLFIYLFMVLADAVLCFFLMIRRPPRSTLDRSSAASDVYKRQVFDKSIIHCHDFYDCCMELIFITHRSCTSFEIAAVSYTHLRAHETVLDLVCRLLLEKKKTQRSETSLIFNNNHHKKYVEDMSI